MKAPAQNSARASPFAALAAAASPIAPLGREILRHPAETRRAVGAKPFEVALEIVAIGGEVLGPRHVDQFGPERQHERGFDFAAVDAVANLLFSEQTRRVAETAPGAGDGERLAPLAQHKGGLRDERRIAAMRIEQHDFAHARADGAFHDLDKDAQRGLMRQRERARKLAVLQRYANALDGKEQGRQIRRAGARSHVRRSPP